MQHPIVLLLVSLMFVVLIYRIGVQPPSSLVVSGKRCDQSVIEGEEVVVGRYPLHARVAMIDYENATIDLITEVGTSLHITQAPAHELKRLQIGDVVEMCISEALHGEAEV